MAKIVDVNYPRSNPEEAEVLVRLMDVRAADDILISYDFDRDGWVIRQDLWEDGDDTSDIVKLTDKVEVAFIPAWNLKE